MDLEKSFGTVKVHIISFDLSLSRIFRSFKSTSRFLSPGLRGLLIRKACTYAHVYVGTLTFCRIKIKI